METVNVLSLSQQQMESVRDGNEHHHLQSVHHHFGMGGGEGEHQHHHQQHHHHPHHHHHHHHHHLQAPHYVVRDGQHFVLREELPGVPHYAVRENDMQGSQQALIALAGGMGVVAPDSHEDHQNKLEIRWTEQGFCEARPEASSAHQMVKEVGGVRWEQPMFNGRGENVSVMEAAHHVVDGHVVLQPEGGRWEDPSLCDANDEEEMPNDGEQLDSKRTREVRWTEQALCDAVQAVKSGTLTAYKASKDYGIPRSTLRNWLNGRNRSRKRGPRVDEALSFCRQELPAEPAGNLMMSNEVTINSGEEGHGSDSRDDGLWRKRRQVWTKQTLLEALSAVRNGELSVSRAAQVYSIPNSTLDYWLKEHEKKAGMDMGNAYGQPQPLHGRDEYGLSVAQGMEIHDDEDDDEEEEDEEEDEGGDEQMPGSSEKKERLKKKAREGKKKVGSWTEKALMEAMEAIKNNTLTICKASRAYGIPRTTLRNWITGRTRSRKRGPHTGLPYEQSGDTSLGEEAMKMAGEDFQYNEVSEDLTPGREENGESEGRELGDMSMSGSKRRGKGGKWSEQALLDAVEAVRNGSCTMGTAGQQFGVPQTPMKFSVNGLPKNSPSGEAKGEDEEVAFDAVEMKEPDEKTKKSNGWTEQALQDALQAVKNGYSIRKAGQHFGIPRTTLRNWLNGRTHSRKRGPHGGMTRGEQESAIVEWFFSVQQVCQSLTTLNSLRRRVATLSVNKGSPFKDGVPVKKWWLWFNRRYPDVASRVSEGLQEAQHRNLIDEMSVVHMITGEHLQILRRRVEGEQEDVGLVRRAEDMDSSSQDEHEDHPEAGPGVDHQHLVDNGMLGTGATEHAML